MNDDLLHKLFDHGRSQFREVSVLLRQLNEFVDTDFILPVFVQLLLAVRNALLQLGLFSFIVGSHHLETLLRDLARGVGLIQLLKQRIQLRAAFPIPGKVLLQLLGGCVVLDLRFGAHLPGECFRISNSTLADRTDGIQQQGAYCLGADVMVTAYFGFPTACPGIR